MLVEIIDADWERVSIADPIGASGQPRFGRVKVSLVPP
jgi:hypothetical protein